MSNNCYNYIVISEINDEERKKIVEWFNTYDEFDSITKWVESIVDNKHYHLEDYGGRWFEADIQQEDENGIIISGDSAWSPMLGMCKALSNQFQCDIQIDFEELGNDMGGQYYYSCGNETINFDGGYWEYVYWNTGLEHLYIELEYEEHPEELKERFEEFLSINGMTNEDKILLTEYYEEVLIEISKN